MSPQEVRCLQPTVPLPFRGHVEVSLDGQVYSRTRAPYDVVGVPVGLQVPDGLGPGAVLAARVTRLPAVVARTVDANGLWVGAYDIRSPAVTAALELVGGPSGPVPLQNSTVQAAAGRAVLRGMAVHAPAAGQYALRLTAPGLAAAEVHFSIRSGVPAALYVVAQPSGVTDNVNALADQPICGLQVILPVAPKAWCWFGTESAPSPLHHSPLCQPPPPPPQEKERIIVVVRSPCQENYPADAHPCAHKSVLESANPRMDSGCASGCTWSTARATARLRDSRPWSSQTGQVIRGLR